MLAVERAAVAGNVAGVDGILSQAMDPPSAEGVAAAVTAAAAAWESHDDPAAGTASVRELHPRPPFLRRAAGEDLLFAAVHGVRGAAVVVDVAAGLEDCSWMSLDWLRQRSQLLIGGCVPR